MGRAPSDQDSLDAAQVGKVAPLYRSLLGIERGAPDEKQGMRLSHSHLVSELQRQGVSYEEFVFSL